MQQLCFQTRKAQGEGGGESGLNLEYHKKLHQVETIFSQQYSTVGRSLVKGVAQLVKEENAKHCFLGLW